MTDKLVFDKEISISFAGEAGQGIETITDLTAIIIKDSGYNVFTTKEYMSRVRGGCNSSSIRISSKKVCAYKERIDFLFALSKDAVKHLEKRISGNTIIFYESYNQEFLETIGKKIKIDFSLLSKEIGGSIYINIICFGIISGLLNINADLSKKHLQQYFSNKNNDVINKNLSAFSKGYEIGKNIKVEQNILINIETNMDLAGENYVNGNDSLAIGCVAGGCDFISAYPMSPSTGVLTYMAQHSDDFDIIVEQAEDEIAAMNLGLGAWYAGARAMTTTSGGGFDLMTEALSLAGMIESPMVICLAQRPGPATGLPTRTEQGDLNLALYSGHSEFPRIILAPGSLDEGFLLSQQAFNITDEFQVPVFILVDQYFVDFAHNTKSFDIEQTEIKEYITKTSINYKRYEVTQNGISPRGIPDWGEGLVVVDSDEHDKEGHITENLDLRTQMVDKRLKKLDEIKKAVIPPVFIGSENYKTLVIGWGSTFHVIKEALEEISNTDIAFLHFKQVYPLKKEALDYLQKAKKVICIENNATGQFANLLKLETGYSVNQKILKYNGLPFSVEELVSKIKLEAAK